MCTFACLHEHVYARLCMQFILWTHTYVDICTHVPMRTYVYVRASLYIADRERGIAISMMCPMLGGVGGGIGLVMVGEVMLRSGGDCWWVGLVANAPMSGRGINIKGGFVCKKDPV